MLLAIEGRAKAHEREARERRELAYLTAVLPRLKRFPSYRAFVGEAAAGPRLEQTPEEMERILDHWGLVMRSATVRERTLGGTGI